MATGLATELKAEIVKGAQLKEGDTGSPEVQVSLLTARINHLTNNHIKQNKKDKHSTRGLLQMVNDRRKLLKYLKKRDLERYMNLIKKLNLRDNIK